MPYWEDHGWQQGSLSYPTPLYVMIQSKVVYFSSRTKQREVDKKFIIWH